MSYAHFNLKQQPTERFGCHQPATCHRRRHRHSQRPPTSHHKSPRESGLDFTEERKKKLARKYFYEIYFLLSTVKKKKKNFFLHFSDIFFYLSLSFFIYPSISPLSLSSFSLFIQSPSFTLYPSNLSHSLSFSIYPFILSLYILSFSTHLTLFLSLSVFLPLSFSFSLSLSPRKILKVEKRQIKKNLKKF